MGAAVGNIMATIMTIQIARNSGARRPMVGESIAISISTDRALPGEHRPCRRCERQQQAQDDVALKCDRIGLGAVYASVSSRHRIAARAEAREAAGAAPLVRPADRRVMAVLAGIVPAHAVVGEGAALGAHSERELVRRDRMARPPPKSRRCYAWSAGAPPPYA